MKIKELIKALKNFDPNMRVVIEEEGTSGFAYDIYEIKKEDIILLDEKQTLMLSPESDSPLMVDYPDEDEENE